MPPTTGATDATMPTPNGTRAGGSVWRTSPNASGIAAADNPWMPRPITTPSSVGALKLSSEPHSESASTTSSTRLRPNKSPRRPDSATDEAAVR